MFEKKIMQIKGAIQSGDEGDERKALEERDERKGNLDVLGFTALQWEEMLENLTTTEGKIKAITMASQALSSSFVRFSALQKVLNDKELKDFTKIQASKKKALLKQLNQGLITQEQYHKGLQNLEQETAEKKRKIQQREAKAQKAANIVNAISGTALAVINALKSAPFPANLALAAVVGAMGAVKTATIASQPIPEFSKGGFTGNGIGKADKSGFRPVGIVHEHEYVTPKWMLENPVIADVVEWMESIRLGHVKEPKGFEKGGKTSPIAPHNNNNHNNHGYEKQNTDAQFMVVLSDLKEILADLKHNGIEAYMLEDAENGRRIKRTIKLFENIQSKNARKFS